jgi:hypothetical protein
MKRVIIAVVVLFLILTMGILETVYVDILFNELDNRLEQCTEAVKTDSPSAYDLIKDTGIWWETRRKYLELFTYSPDLRAFSVALAEAEGSAECGDFQNALSKCVSLQLMAKNIHNILDFNMEDII